MSTFDIRTAFLIIGLLYLLLPTVTWIVLAEQHKLQVALWCGGGLLMGIGAISISLYGYIPDWVLACLTALMFQVSLLVRIQSLRLDLGIPWRWRWIVLAEMVFFLIFMVIHLGLQDYQLRVQFNSSVLAGLFIHLAALAWRIGREEPSRSARWITHVYGLVAAALLFRMFSLPGSGGINILLAEGFSARLLALSLLLSSVVGHFGYVGLALDRSMRRELKAAADRARDEESRRLGDQIAQLDRQRSLGELSASLGHELNQPLTAILTNAQVAKRGLQMDRFDTTQLSAFFDKIVHNTQRATQIVERIRGFIRPSTSGSMQVDLILIVSEVVELVADEAQRCKVSFVLPATPISVLVAGDPIQLSQIILNGFRNAIEAMAQQALREIQVSYSHTNGRAIVRIRDTGPGLTPDALDQVGSPFFTTKPDGLGMGFSISRSIASQHGGTLFITNAAPEDGGGAVLELNLPTLSEAKP